MPDSPPPDDSGPGFGAAGWKALVRARLATLDVDPARASDIVDELAQHVAQHYADLVASGTPERAAMETALAPLDDPARIAAEIARADRPRKAAPAPPAGSGSVIEDVSRDLRYAARLLMRAPGFAAVAIVTLALGIGANTAIFSVVNSVLLRPLPYADPDRIVLVGDREKDASAGNVGFITFLDWRDRSHAFDQLAMIRSWQTTLVTDAGPERIAGMRVSSNFFRMLGVAPAIGRDFRSEEDNPNDWRVVLISDGLWRRRFNADASIVGRVLTMNDRQFSVIGVMPRTFEPLISEHFYQPAEIWSLVGYDRTSTFACRGCQHLKAIARIKPRVSIEAARLDIDAVQAQLRHEYPQEYAQETMTVVPIGEELTGRVRPALAVLTGAVVVVLLIACANIANLLLARVAARERDLALRTALGASRSRLVRQLLAESVLLALAGGCAGVFLSAIGVPVLTRLAPASMSRLAEAHVDARAIAFSAALSLGTALVFGLIPAIRASRVNLLEPLHVDARRTSRAPTSLSRRLLVAADVALAVILIVAAGLMIKSVERLIGVSPGFDPDGVLTMQISMVGQKYATDPPVVATTDRILEKMRALPGVDAAAAAGQIPLSGNRDCWGMHVEGRRVTPEDLCVERYSVTPDYFSVMRIPLKRGRLSTDHDRDGTEQMILLGEETARALWPNDDPIGRHVRIGDGTKGPWRTIVGIVGDVRHQALAAPPTPQMYTPQAQLTDSFVTIVIRSGMDPTILAGEARRAIWSVANDVPIYEVAPLTDLVSRSVGPRRFLMLLLETFGAVALLMTAIGLYGAISYSVAERTREIGIRAALGASRADIARLVARSGLATVLSGLAAGIIGAAAVTRFLEGSLYGVTATDPGTFAAAVGVLFAVTLAAHGIPLVRALRVDPAIALRDE